METDQLSKRSLVIDEKSQYQLYKKQAFRHFINYLILGIKYILTYRKEKFTKRLLTYGAIFFAIAYPFYYYIVNPNVVEKWKIMPEKVVYVSDETKTMDKFLEVLGDAESGGDYKSVNQLGYMGKYQFGRDALTQIGLGSVTNEQFLDNPELQEASIRMLLKENKRILASYIGKYQSRVIGGIYITESGILGAAHMAPQGAIDFLTSGGTKVFIDGNKYPITKYLEKFSGYKIKLK